MLNKIVFKIGTIFQLFFHFSNLPFVSTKAQQTVEQRGNFAEMKRSRYAYICNVLRGSSSLEKVVKRAEMQTFAS